MSVVLRSIRHSVRLKSPTTLRGDSKTPRSLNDLSECSTFSTRYESRPVSLCSLDDSIKITLSNPKVKDYLTQDFNRFGTDIPLETAVKMILADPDNEERYIEVRKVLFSFSKSQFETKDDCFKYMVSRFSSSIDKLAMVLLLFSQKTYINRLVDTCPEFAASKYGKILKIQRSPSFLRVSTPSLLPELSPRFSIKAECLSLQHFGIFKEDVEVFKASDRELAFYLKSFAECPQISVRAVISLLEGREYRFHYFVISNASFIAIIDTEELNNEKSREGDFAWKKLQIEFKEMLLPLLTAKNKILFTYDARQLAIFLRKGLNCSSEDLKAVTNVVDRVRSVIEYAKTQSPVTQIFSSQIDTIYQKLVYTLFRGRIDYEASLDSWGARPILPEQAHYLALSTYLLLKVHEAFDMIKCEYKIAKSLKKACSIQKKVLSRDSPTSVTIQKPLYVGL